MQSCFVGPSAATPESCQRHVLGLAVPQGEPNYELQGEEKTDAGHEYLQSQRLWHTTRKLEHPVLCLGQNFCLISDICQWLLARSWVK